MSLDFDRETEALMAEALRGTAHPDREVAQRNMRAFAQALDVPLREGVMDESNLGDIYEEEPLQPGAHAFYPLDIIKPGEEDNHTAFTYQNQNRIPERRVEADEVTIPTYRIANAIDWDIDIAKDARFNLVRRALEVYRAGFTRKLNYDGWTTLLAAAVQRGLIVSAATGAGNPFTGHVVQGSATIGGEFTKELVSRMIITMMRGAGGNAVRTNLTDLYVSVEAVADMRAWNATDVDEFTRRELLTTQQFGLASLYGVVIHPMQELGVGQDYQTILTSLGATQPSGTTQFAVGLDLSARDSFVMPVRDQLETRDDETLHRQWRMGVYGSMRMGFGCLDVRRVLLGAH